MTMFLKRVYKIYKIWQLEDVNLKTELDSLQFQEAHPPFRSSRRYTAMCKSRSSHMKLEHNKLLPNEQLIAFPNRSAWLSWLLITSKWIPKVNCSGAIFMPPPDSFIMRPQYMAMWTAHLRHLCLTAVLEALDGTSAVEDILCQWLSSGNASDFKHED